MYKYIYTLANIERDAGVVLLNLKKTRI